MLSLYQSNCYLYSYNCATHCNLVILLLYCPVLFYRNLVGDISLQFSGLHFAEKKSNLLSRSGTKNLENGCLISYLWRLMSTADCGLLYLTICSNGNKYTLIQSPDIANMSNPNHFFVPCPSSWKSFLRREKALTFCIKSSLTFYEISASKPSSITLIRLNVCSLCK